MAKNLSETIDSLADDISVCMTDNFRWYSRLVEAGKMTPEQMLMVKKLCQQANGLITRIVKFNRNNPEMDRNI